MRISESRSSGMKRQVLVRAVGARVFLMLGIGSHR